MRKLQGRILFTQWGKKGLVSGKLRNDRYSDEIIEIAHNARNMELIQDR